MRIGIDLGGTKTEIICIDRKNGKELYRHRVPTARDDYNATVQALKALIDQAEGTLGKTGTIGIGIPGTVSRDTRVIKNANSVWLNGKPLDRDLSAAMGRPVRIQNDANCFAVSEAADGAGEGKRIVFGVIIGTGCGAGIAIDGKAHDGLNSIAGEWGHNPLPYPVVYAADAGSLYAPFERFPGVTDTLDRYVTNDQSIAEYPGPLCYCGRRGCLETWISGTGFKSDYHRVTGETLSTHDIIAAAREGESKAVAALNRYTDRIARGLAGIVNILDPDVIVLGGGMSNVSSLYEDIPKVWGKYVFSDTVRTMIVPARHGDSSGVRGAAWLWSKDE